MIKTNPIKQFFIIAFFLSLAITVTIHFPMVISYIFGDERGGGGQREQDSNLAHLLSDIVITSVVAMMMFTLNFFILKPVEKHVKLSVYRIFIAVFLTIVSVYIVNDLLHPLFHGTDGSRHRGSRDEFDYINFFVSGLVIASTFMIRLIFQKQNVILENEQLKSEALQSQYESLKNQLSPHFLFNSLTALKTLIREAPETAQKYVNSLSRALRYTLQSNEKQLVTLSEEMIFLDSYLYLIKLRFDTNLSIDMDINKEYSAYKLPPLTIQTLVENSIKHNEISKEKPLKISIMTTDNEKLAVWNDIQEKISEEEGTGIGLTNLSKQFQLLTGEDITISNQNNQFRVAVPLIKP